MTKQNKTKTVSARITLETFEKAKEQGLKISKIISEAITSEVNSHKVVLVDNGKFEFKRVKIDND